MDRDLLRLKKSIINKKTVFFVASGISLRAGLPTASDLMNLTCASVLPHISEKEKKYIMTIQPELYYSVLLEGSNNNVDVLSMWSCFHPALWTTYSEENYHPAPTIEHYFIVAYSYISRVPIFTTNYDTMLEMACNNLNIPYKVLIYSDSPENIYSDEDNKVYICKIHGDIYGDTKHFDAGVLKTTMEAITQKNEAWLNIISDYMDKYDYCFCGYSGRDIDYYPCIKDYRLSNQVKTDVFWLQRYDNSSLTGLEKKTLVNARGINAIVVNGFPSEIFPRIIHEVFVDNKCYVYKIEHILSNTFLFADRNKHQFLERLKRDSAFCVPDCNQLVWERFLMVLLFARTGKIRMACNKLKEFYKDNYLQESPLWLQKKILEIDMMLCREQCRIYSYRKKAYKLLFLSQRDNDIGLRLHAELQIIGSYHLEILSVEGIALPFYFRGYLRVLYLIILYNIWLFEVYIRMNHNQDFFAENAVLVEEGRVRYYGLLVGIAEKLDNKILKLYLKKKFINIYNESYKYGIYISLIGACKYLSIIDDGNCYWREKGEAFSRMVKEKSSMAILSKGSKHSIKMAKANDNVLNVIKGYIALVEKRRKDGIRPLLDNFEMQEFINYEHRVESRYLRRQIRFVKKHFMD